MLDSLNALYEKATAAYMEGAFEQGLLLCDRALEQAPGQPAFHYLQGLFLFQAGDLHKAEAAIENAIQFDSGQPDFYNSLGVVKAKLGQGPQAIAAYQKAIELKPNFAEAYNNLGDAHLAQNQWELAEENLRRAILFNRRYPDAHYNLGNLMKKSARLEQAIEQFDWCLALDARHSGAHWNRSLALLSLGEYLAAWPGYEWRFFLPEFPKRRDLGRSIWKGESLAGKRILVYCEQGLGDSIQFIRFLRPLLDDASDVILECPARMMTLLSTFDERLTLVANGERLPESDFCLPLMSLAGVLQFKMEQLEQCCPYLRVLPNWVESYRGKVSLDASKGMRIGIQWQGAKSFCDDAMRSVALEQWKPLWSLENIQWVSLQQHDGLEQLTAEHPVLDAGSVLDNGVDGFVETAALLTDLDLLITTDTALVHLAGALNIPTWLIVGYNPEWRWGIAGQTSPWYSSVRIFREKEKGGWSLVFQQLCEELREFRLVG